MTSTLERGEWSAVRPGRTLPPGKTRCPLYRRLGGPQGRSGQAENLSPNGIRSPDHPARSQSLYPLSYPAHCEMSRACNKLHLDNIRNAYKNFSLKTWKYMRYQNEIILLFRHYLFLGKPCRLPAIVARNMHTCIIDNIMFKLCQQHFLLLRNIVGIICITIEA
jgi:hypothetical protein